MFDPKAHKRLWKQFTHNTNRYLNKRIQADTTNLQSLTWDASTIPRKIRVWISSSKIINSRNIINKTRSNQMSHKTQTSKRKGEQTWQNVWWLNRQLTCISNSQSTVREKQPSFPEPSAIKRLYLANETFQTNLVSCAFRLSMYANFSSFLFFVILFLPMNGENVNYQMFQLTNALCSQM